MPDHHFLRSSQVSRGSSVVHQVTNSKVKFANSIFILAQESVRVGSCFQAECTCIDGTILEGDGDGNTLAGEYRYRDPLGNTITVKYSYDKSGAGYSEKRRIDTTSSILATSAAFPAAAPLPEEVAIDVDEIAAKVTRQVRDMLPLIIREAVATTNADEDRSRMIERVRSKVRSVILGSLRDAVGGDTELNLDVITGVIMESLNDSFVATIEKETEITPIDTSESSAEVDQVRKFVLQVQE